MTWVAPAGRGPRPGFVRAGGAPSLLSGERKRPFVSKNRAQADGGEPGSGAIQVTAPDPSGASAIAASNPRPAWGSLIDCSGSSGAPAFDRRTM